MTDHVEGLAVVDFARGADGYGFPPDHSPIQTHERPISPIIRQLSSQELFPSVNIVCGELRPRRGGVRHVEAEDEPHRGKIRRVLHAVPRRGNDIRGDEGTRAEAAGGLLDERLAAAEIEGVLVRLRRQVERSVGVLVEVGCLDERHHRVRGAAHRRLGDLVDVLTVVGAVYDTLASLRGAHQLAGRHAGEIAGAAGWGSGRPRAVSRSCATLAPPDLAKQFVVGPILAQSFHDLPPSSTVVLAARWPRPTH